MSPAERDAFLRRPHTAVLSTLSRSGRIHAVPVWFLWDGTSFGILTERGSVKHRNAARGGRAALCIDERDGVYRYLTAEGPVHVTDPVTYDQRLALHTLYRGPERAREIVEGGGHEQMVMLRLTPERWLGWP